MKWKLLVIAAIVAAFNSSCKKNSEDSSEESNSLETVMTAALSEVASHASSSEGGSGFVAAQASAHLDVLENELQFAKNGLGIAKDQVNQAATGCRYASRTCSSSTGTINWDGCTISGPRASITMTGGWTETWTNVGDCSNGYLSSSDSVTRSSSGSTINFLGGATITTDTSGGTAYNGTVFASGGVITTRSNTHNRAIGMSPTNSAIHKVFKGRRGTTLFDYYLVPSLTITGAKTNGTNSGLGTSSANRSVSGTIVVHHNLAQYSATNTFTGVTWSDSSCCFPVSGSISSSFTGSGAPSGPVTLTFTSNCGVATFATPEGTNDIELTSCQ